MNTDRWHTTGERAEEIPAQMRAEGESDNDDVRSIIATLPPGNFRVDVLFGNRDSDVALDLEIAFVDAAGMQWLRRSAGRLQQLQKAPIEHYESPWF